MHFRRQLGAALSGLLLLSTNVAMGWGHLKYLRDGDGSHALGTLTHVARTKSEILYCAQSDNESVVPQKNLSAQVRMALSVWLYAAQTAKGAQATVREVACGSGTSNLVVHYGSEAEHKDLGAYQLALQKDALHYSSIKLNGDFRIKYLEVEMAWYDFFRLFPSPEVAQTQMEEISLRRPMTAAQFGQKMGIGGWTYYSIYRALLHEVGHSFGLCDTYEPHVDKCDSEHSSVSHPPSMMQNTEYYYLTEDDRAGILALFARQL